MYASTSVTGNFISPMLTIIALNLLYYVPLIILIVLGIRALLKYLRSGDRRPETAAIRRTLGETLREHRTRCNMTQEFVAESLGVTRQAVSKWETGAAEPSTTNLLALAKLYGVAADELLRGVEQRPE